MFVYTDDSPEYVDSEMFSVEGRVQEVDDSTLSTKEKLERIKVDNLSLKIALDRLQCRYQVFLASNHLKKDVVDTIFELEKQLSRSNAQSSPRESRAVLSELDSMRKELEKRKESPVLTNSSTQTIPDPNISNSLLKELEPSPEDENDLVKLKEKLYCALQTIRNLQSSKGNDAITQGRIKEMERVIGEMDGKNKQQLMEIERLKKENAQLHASPHETESLMRALTDSEHKRKKLETVNQELMQQNNQLYTDISTFREASRMSDFDSDFESQSFTPIQHNQYSHRSPSIYGLRSPKPSDNSEEMIRIYMKYCEELISCIFESFDQRKTVHLEFPRSIEEASKTHDIVLEAIRLQSEGVTEVFSTSNNVSDSVYDLVQIVKEIFAKISQEMHKEHTELLNALVTSAS